MLLKYYRIGFPYFKFCRFKDQTNSMRRLLLLLNFLLPLIVFCQKLPSLEQKTAGLKKQAGFFTFYRDEENGKIWLQIDHFDSSFIYVTSLPAGLGSNDIGLDRGLLGATRVVHFNRVGRKVLLVQSNYRYRA